MNEVFLTPTADDGVVELSRTLFRKKILPKGTIDYKGRKITFDDAYLAEVEQAFKDAAYDQVPFMLAGSDNAHTMDPERFRGEIKGVEVQEDGLWGTFELSGGAAELVKENPNLGVSARLVHDYHRTDGKQYRVAMQHVLGTLDPRIPGMGAWKEIELSGYDSGEQVIDLTNASYEGEAPVPENEETKDPSVVSEEDARKALALLGITDAAEQDAILSADFEDADEPEDEPDSDEGETKTDTEVPSKDPEVDPANPEPAEEKVEVKLSNEDPKTVDLANQVAALKRQLAEDRFKSEKAAYVRKGVPANLVDLAQPVLEAPDGAVIDLSNGVEDNKVDAGAIVRGLLDSCAGYIELAKERGHSVELSNEDQAEKDKTDELLSAWAAMDKSLGRDK